MTRSESTTCESFPQTAIHKNGDHDDMDMNNAVAVLHAESSLTEGPNDGIHLSWAARPADRYRLEALERASAQ